MLATAILGTLADEQAGLVRLEPHEVGTTRDQVGLPRQPGDPEAMTYVGRFQRQIDGAGLPVLTRRDVQLVRRREGELPAVVLIVRELPPPLAPGDRDEER